MTTTTSPIASPELPASPARPAGNRAVGLALNIAIGVTLLVALYAAFGFWLAPRLIHDQVIAQAAQRYHRTARLGEVRLNPFTLRLDAADFALPDADGRPMIGFGHLTVQVAPASLWRGLDFTEIAVEAPRLRLVVRPGGRLNLQDLVLPSAKPEKPGPPPKVLVDRLDVRHGAAEFVDLDGPTPFTKQFTPFGFDLRDFSTVKDGARFGFRATTERGEQIVWRGTFGTAPLTSRGTVDLTGIKTQPLAALAGDALPVNVEGGALDIASSYDFALDREKLKLAIDVGQAKLTGLGLRAKSADRDWVTLPQVIASGAHIDVPARSVSVAKVELDNPSLLAWLDKDGVNLARFAGPPAKSASTAKPAPAWTVSLPDLSLHGGGASFEDRTAVRPVKVVASAVDLTVSGLALPIAKPVQVQLAAGIDGGGRIAVKGPLTLDKPAANLDVEASGLTLPRLQPYLERSANLRLLSGRFGAKGHVTWSAAGDAHFTGQARLDDLHTVDRVLSQDLVNWRSLDLRGIDARAKPFAVKVAAVTAQQPYAKLVIGPGYVTNIQDVFSPPGAAPTGKARTPAAAQAPKQALPVEIGLVRIQNGTMDYADLTLNPHFAAGIQALNGTIKGLSGRQDARAAVDLDGQVDRYAPVKINGQINYFAARSYTDVAMSFHNMELTTLSPYSGKFAGYRIDKGKLNIDLHYNIDDQKLHATHHVVINQLQLGDKVDSADAVKLPVKLIVALLKDRNGVIDVPIEIDGSLDDPKFRVWPLVWHIVHNLMVKVATAPFAAIGHLFGGGEELSHVEFAPGAATLDAAAAARAATLAQALTEHPAVNLEIPMIVDPSLDRPVLAQARYEALIAAGQAAFKPPGKAWYGKAPTPAAIRRAMLEQLYQKEFGAKPEIPKPSEAKQDPDQLAIDWLEARIRAHVVVSDQELQQLGRERAQAVQDAILKDGHVEPTRVFIVTAPPTDAPQVSMQLTLK